MTNVAKIIEFMMFIINFIKIKKSIPNIMNLAKIIKFMISLYYIHSKNKNQDLDFRYVIKAVVLMININFIVMMKLILVNALQIDFVVAICL